MRVQGPGVRVLSSMVLASKAALEGAAEKWWREMMPLHFEVSATRRYGYQARKGDNEPMRVPRGDGKPGTRLNRKYSWVKRFRKGHNRPLVWSGESERSAKSGYVLKSTRSGGQIRTRLIMNLPKYFYQYRKDYGAPDKVSELTRVTEQEATTLRGEYERLMVQGVRSAT